jgi:hypothetical protein
MIDIFSSHYHGIAAKKSYVTYNTNEWKKFYNSLIFIFEIERELYE